MDQWQILLDLAAEDIVLGGEIPQGTRFGAMGFGLHTNVAQAFYFNYEDHMNFETIAHSIKHLHKPNGGTAKFLRQTMERMKCVSSISPREQGNTI